MPSEPGPGSSAMLPPEDLREVIRHTREQWARSEGRAPPPRRGAGFMGRWLLESFLAANREHAPGRGHRADPLSGAVRREVPPPRDGAFAGGSTGEMTRGALPEGAFTHLVHAATAEGIPRRRPRRRPLVRAARSAWSDAPPRSRRGFLLVAAGAVYDRPGRGLPPFARRTP